MIRSRSSWLSIFAVPAGSSEAGGAVHRADAGYTQETIDWRFNDDRPRVFRAGRLKWLSSNLLTFALSASEDGWELVGHSPNPATGDDSVSLVVTVYACGARRSAPPEHALVAFDLVDRVVARER